MVYVDLIKYFWAMQLFQMKNWHLKLQNMDFFSINHNNGRERLSSLNSKIKLPKNELPFFNCSKRGRKKYITFNNRYAQNYTIHS